MRAFRRVGNRQIVLLPGTLCASPLVREGFLVSRWELQLAELVLPTKRVPRWHDRRTEKILWRRSYRRRVRQLLRRACLVGERFC
ncbi:hypothetical protein [Candidatus Methylacidithermus pantelleriae]|uniref:hypothetical protein n=1 Tax=Candidatus Methylacidithermus pantelleriae TaxID=2744239 RepID=UPI00157CE841|nr:hypothetical protein [Candidatus Methylacidithermus pantelleriae]